MASGVRRFIFHAWNRANPMMTRPRVFSKPARKGATAAIATSATRPRANLPTVMRGALESTVAMTGRTVALSGARSAAGTAGAVAAAEAGATAAVVDVELCSVADLKM